MYLIPKIDVDDVDPSEDPEDLSVDVEDEEEADSGETSLSPARMRGRSSPLSSREEDNGMTGEEMEDEDDTDEIADEDDIEDDDAVKRDHPKVRGSLSQTLLWRICQKLHQVW